MRTDPAPSFGALLREYRLAAGLSQEALAERAGISTRGISDLEREARRGPQRVTVARLAGALELGDRERAALEGAVSRRRAPRRPPLGARRPAIAAWHTGGERPPLVGRTHELALLERHLGGEGPPVLLLAGEPGIGKTRLLLEAMERAVALGVHALHGGCGRSGGQEPYAPLPAALLSALRGRPPADQRRSLAGCAWLVRLLPELAGRPGDGTAMVEALPNWVLSPEQERRLMFEAVVRFLGNVAAPSGALLLLDDLQWAGRDGLDLLAMVSRAAAEGGLRVLCTYRDTEVNPQHPLSVLLADLAGSGLAHHRRLGPLTAAEPP